jgi:hypothetical protein
MFLHIPNSIILMKNTICHYFMLIESPVWELSTTEFKSLTGVHMN